MTPAEHRRQRSDVERSILTDAARETHHDVYSNRPARAPEGSTVAACAQSIRELGEMLTAADHLPVLPERLLELERLALRVENRLDTLRALIARDAS